VDPKIAEHRGRIVKTTGDGLLVEFASVVDAVRCAVEVQQAMPERDMGIGADSRIELRIGINLGDVILEGDDRYGDGVNIAARIEALPRAVTHTAGIARIGARSRSTTPILMACGLLTPQALVLPFWRRCVQATNSAMVCAAAAAGSPVPASGASGAHQAAWDSRETAFATCSSSHVCAIGSSEIHMECIVNALIGESSSSPSVAAI
jgi:hypothetical protein